MSIAVRQADLQKDWDVVVRFCRDNLPGKPDGSRFEWLYLKNPFGTARTLIATASATGEMVGVASAFPRPLWMEGIRRQAWILGDFCISERFRTLGPAAILQRACIASIPSPDVWYDFPSQNMLGVYRRLGVPLFGRLVRHVLVLKVDCTQTSARGYLSACAGKAVTSLKSLGQAFPLAADLECSEYEDDFGAEFTELDNDPETHHLVRGLRSEAYLNWRYRHSPDSGYRVITARRGRRLVGYLILKTGIREATLVDLLALHVEKTVPTLLAHARSLLRGSTVSRLTASLLTESILTRYFRLAGFIPREALPIVVRGWQDSVSAVFRPQNWVLLHGDRES